MKKQLQCFLCGSLMLLCLAGPVSAYDYEFEAKNGEEFLQADVSTHTYDGTIPGYVQELYDFTPQTVHDSRWGATVIAPELVAGYGQGAQKPANAPGPLAGGVAASPSNSPTTGISQNSSIPVFYPENTVSQDVNHYAITPVEDVRKSDGSIGTLKIPAIGLTVTAYDGDITAAMKKGVGHIGSASAWVGNVGLSGHNRGVTLHFGKLKTLKLGDEIIYTTSLGSRSYSVTAVEKIAANDWSWLQYTTDNRITLITCVEDQPQYRLVVQAVEKS